VQVSRDRLEREMARRGWNSSQLAKAAGVSPATVTAMRSGRSVSPGTVRAIALALSQVPAVDGIDGLLL
jgi:DNA-binding Xre family transcriptional regulator